jgi:hypothetical protein
MGAVVMVLVVLVLVVALVVSLANWGSFVLAVTTLRGVWW